MNHLFSDNHTIWRADTEVDGNAGNALICSRDSVCLCFDLPSDIIEVCKLLSFTVQKLAVLCGGEWKYELEKAEDDSALREATALNNL